LFVEAAERWKNVKPQAWFDSPAVRLPDDPLAAEETSQAGGQSDARIEDGRRQFRRLRDDPPAQTGGDTPTEEEGSNGNESNPIPVVKPSGTIITQSGIKSTFDVTQEMLDDSNFETLEHVTVRVWIEHQRRGDVEVEIMSPAGITSVLARVRRFDEDTNGFPGWKFMSLKHW
jgi:kexin